MVEHDSQLPGDANYRSFLGVLPSTFSQLQTPAAQVAVRTKGPQDVLGGSDEQTAQVGVPRFRDSQLGILIAGLIPPGDEPNGRTDLPAAVEAIRVFKCENEGQGSERAHTADRTEQPGLRVAFAAKLFVRLVIGLDLLGEGSDGLEDRVQSRSQGRGDVGGNFASEAVGGAGGQARSGGFDDVAGMVNE